MCKDKLHLLNNHIDARNELSDILTILASSDTALTRLWVDTITRTT